MTPNPDDSVEITIETPYKIANLFEQLHEIRRLGKSMRTYAGRQRTR